MPGKKIVLRSNIFIKLKMRLYSVSVGELHKQLLCRIL